MCGFCCMACVSDAEDCVKKVKERVEEKQCRKIDEEIS